MASVGSKAEREQAEARRLAPLVAGFVVGRLGKGVMNAADSSSSMTGKPR